MTGTLDGEDSPRSLDTVYDLLTSEYRRYVLSYLRTKDTDAAKLGELAEHIYEEVDEITARNQARIALVHAHLPKLADHGVIEYDRRSETVRYRDGRQVEAILEGAARE